MIPLSFSNFSYLLSFECILITNIQLVSFKTCAKCKFFFSNNPLLNSLRSRDRFTPWLKAKKIKNIEYVKEYYGYSNEKAKAALDVLSDEQIKTIKDSLSKGGNNGK